MKVVSIIGTRPEALKMAPILKLLQEEPLIEALLIVTGQHREMLDQVLTLFSISPHIDLNLQRNSQTLPALLSQMIERISIELKKHTPDWVLVQGDTTTALAASMAAAYEQCKLAHIEAGISSKDKQDPFPEEINRKIITSIADLLFAPTENAKANLIHAGIPANNIIVSGNPIIDTLHPIKDTPVSLINSPLNSIPWHQKLIIITIHRRETHGDIIQKVASAIKELATIYQNKAVHFVLPTHLNPAMEQPIRRILGNAPNITLTPPLPYNHMIYLLKNAYAILTDSGGVQEEAAALGIPVLILRNTTERVEGIESGQAKLIGLDPLDIIMESKKLIETPKIHKKMARKTEIYGDGKSASRIVSALLERH